MSKMLDLTGKQFGDLKAISYSVTRKRQTMWLCECKCGKRGLYSVGNLRAGKSTRCRSCGTKASAITKGIVRKDTIPGYKVWLWVKKKKNIDNRWKKFEVFIKDMGYPPSDKRRLTRINTKGKFCTDNCRWTAGLTAIAKKIGITRNGIICRIKRGMSFEEATTNGRQRGKRVS